MPKFEGTIVGDDTPIRFEGTLVDGPSSSLRDKGRAALSGSLWGFGDEATAGLAAIPAAIATGTSPVAAYKDIRDAEREGMAQYRNQFPLEAGAIELGSGLMTGGAGAARSVGGQALKAVERVWKNAKLGSKMGAVAGYGYSDADSIGGDIANTAGGAALGGVMGPAISEGLPKAGSMVMSALNRLYQGKGYNAGTRAGRELQKAMRQDQLAPEQMMARMQRGGKDYTLADTGGENVVNLLDTVMTPSGSARNTGKQFLDQRNRAQPERIDEMLDTVFSGSGGFREKFNSIIGARREESRPMYDALHSLDVSVPKQTADLLASKPSVRSSIPIANRLLKEQGYPPLDPRPHMWNMRDWDFVKQGLVDHSNAVRTKMSGVQKGMTNSERSIRNTERELVDTLDNLTGGAYRETLGMYAGHKRTEEALDLGRKFLKEDADYLDEMMQYFGPQEVEAFKVGALAAMRDKFMRSRKNIDASKQFDTQKFDEQLAAILPDEAARGTFYQFLKRESRMTETKNTALGNSSTAKRMANQAEGGIDPNIAAATVVGGPQAGLMTALSSGARKMFTPSGMPEPTRDALGNILLNPNLTEEGLQQFLKQGQPYQFKQGGAGLLGSTVPLLGSENYTGNR